VPGPLGRLRDWLGSHAEPLDGACADRRWEREQSWLAVGRWVRGADPGGGPPGPARVQERAAEIARLTLGDELWATLRDRGYLDVRSRRIPGLTYRLPLGRRVRRMWDRPGAALRSPWPRLRYLCINPAYPMPAVEFAAQLYLYVRDAEDEVIRAAIAQPYDQAISRVF
jgi:hypothetical protein